MKKIRVWFGRYIKITDTFKPKEGRTENQIYHDAYLRLQNEVINSGFLKIEHLDCGKIKVTLKIKK